jgi:anti-sigma factor RsiW
VAVRSLAIQLLSHRDDHDWSQRHISHYVEGDLAARARRRLERHASGCPGCSRAIRAMKALLRQLLGLRGEQPRAPANAFDRVRADADADGTGDEPGRSEKRL